MAKPGRIVALRAACWLAAMVYAATALAQAAPALFDAEGYRTGSYRAPVDRDPAPARAITGAEVRALGGEALLIDVLPAEGASRDAATGRWILAMPHQTLPGAMWYPDTGRAAPPRPLWAALRARARDFAAHHQHGVLVVFCRADCWMSWNAARRLAREPGLTLPVHWYPEGIDGWHDHGWPLVDAQPQPVSDSQP